MREIPKSCYGSLKFKCFMQLASMVKYYLKNTQCITQRKTQRNTPSSEQSLRLSHHEPSLGIAKQCLNFPIILLISALLFSVHEQWMWNERRRKNRRGKSFIRFSNFFLFSSRRETQVHKVEMERAQKYRAFRLIRLLITIISWAWASKILVMSLWGFRSPTRDLPVQVNSEKFSKFQSKLELVLVVELLIRHLGGPS